ncbi:MAG: hypothetical protein J6O40_05920 [Ruminococcus sp.]|nr:hypothetical protein [Ruminococcus sp.]
MNESLKYYIETLPSELREEAKKCETAKELTEFIQKNDIELPDEILQHVSGGVSSGSKRLAVCKKHKTICVSSGYSLFRCSHCGRNLTLDEIMWANISSN